MFEMIHSNLTEEELSCVLCKEWVVPFITLCPGQPAKRSSRSALYQTTANNHYCCLPCFTLLLSHDRDSKRSKICSVCNVPHNARMHFESSEMTPYITCTQSLLPSKSLIRIVFGDLKHECPTCDHYAGTFLDLVRHYFDECPGFSYYCPHCKDTQVDRYSCVSHYPNHCKHITCSRSGCTIRLYPDNSSTQEAKAWNKIHKRRHNLHDQLHQFARQISYCTPLLDDTKHPTFTTHVRDLFNSISGTICILQNKLLTSVDPDDLSDVKDFIISNTALLQFICNVLQVY